MTELHGVDRGTANELGARLAEQSYKSARLAAIDSGDQARIQTIDEQLYEVNRIIARVGSTAASSLEVVK